MMSNETMRRVVASQRDEITEHHIYRRIAARQPLDANRRLLDRIAADELRHYEQLRSLSGRDVSPCRARVWAFDWISRILGLTFATKLLERGEAEAQEVYRALAKDADAAQDIVREEVEHEAALLNLLDEERLRYISSIVLGLNDALVELTGALAGLTLALQTPRLIAVTGSITGIAAAFSMAASEYLSTKADNPGRHPLKAALYTGGAYLLTVGLLILPYLVVGHLFAALGITLATAVLIIALFNWYLSVVKDLPFGRRFAEMAGLSLGVAALSFGVGYALRVLVGVDV